MFYKKLITIFIFSFTLIAINCYAVSFILNISNLKNEDTFPLKYISTKIGGQNISPEISWNNPPENTKVFVLTCIDKNPIANNWVHWMLIDIPHNIKEIQEGFNKLNSTNCIVCRNSFGYNNYGGPQPPRGTGNHKYVFTLYALNKPLNDIKTGEFITESKLFKLLQNKVISKAVFTLNRSY